ncbi:HD domain-containing protein [Geothermobacter hydrogeniphilus]|uniref:HD domain-containing protein n=1 Tax=Geothermobacter hydrogeniphilus TaxID=1969733 RepID=A0A1X0Y856_9BACT|nr:HD domain-containing protein [Geothermobacter hydrogeniphilus]ORJ61307.1 hypothetical protein B5V00_06660 [Geothermobacter hydrogeniphilus]
MLSDLILLIGGGACLVLILYAAAQLLPQRSRGKKGERRLLGEIAWLWTGKGDVVDFREIARIWRITPEVRNEPQPPPEYAREEIRQFHARWLTLPTVQGEKRQVIEGILSILDSQGNCPSVVQRNKNEAEAKYDKDVFALLAKVPLWQHSLAVAGHLAGGMKQAVMVPDALIAGLGHDLGKIPAYQDTLYRTGDHPILSIIALNRIPGFESMSNMDDISQAIRQHHQLAPENPLGTALKQADQKARLEEISRLSPAGQIRLEEEAGEEKPGEEAAPEVPPVLISKAKTPKKEQPSKSAADSEKTEEELTGSQAAGGQAEEHTPSPSTRDGDFLQDFDLETILDALKKRINRIEKGRWSIISTPEGHVLCQPDALWQEIKKAGRKAPELQLGDADEGTKRKYLGRIVERMSQELNAINTSLVAEGYHTAQCLIVMGSGKAFRVPLIPFRAEAFKALPSQLEALKGPGIRKMVQKVKLPNQESGA